MLVGTAVAFALPDSSPLVPEHDGGDSTWSWLYLCAAAAAFAAYLGGLWVLAGQGAPPRRRAVVTLTCAVQLLPLAGPMILSTDVATYWG